MNTTASPENLHAPLSKTQQLFFITTAFVLVAFGQPAWISIFGLFAAIGGYTLFWRALTCYPLASQRFWLAGIWFFAVQLVQLSWFISHPYLYIYAVYFLLSGIFGFQFAIIGMLINPTKPGSIWRLPAIASLWVLMEWSRLFILSGFSFNPIGIALAGNIYALQMASLWGAFGMSFWVLLTNLLGIRAWAKKWQISSVALWMIAAIMPYLFGVAHIYMHDKAIAERDAEKTTRFNAVLVQTAFPVEEAIDFNTKKNMIAYVIDEWRQILKITKKHYGKSIDLIALPEFVVPFGTYSNIYPIEVVVDAFREILGPESLTALPEPKWPFGSLQARDNDRKMMVNNAYWLQAMANYYGSGVIAGLEDAEDAAGGEREHYSAAILFNAEKENEKADEIAEAYPERYEKRILVPMGEYIPFSFCRELAKQYGVFGSFTAGKEAKVMTCGGVPFSPSICYEETFGDLMREGRQKGAEMLVNLTSDVWYPNSRLPLQHLEHARLRTVENGVPLLRACNTGVTAAIDSLGRTVAVLGGNDLQKAEWISDSLFVEVPTYIYSTLYSQFGDLIIIGLSFLILSISIYHRRFP